MKIVDAIQVDLAFARQCGLQSAKELEYLLNGTQSLTAEEAVVFLKNRYKEAASFTDLAQKDLVRSICNIYLHMLDIPEKDQ